MATITIPNFNTEKVVCGLNTYQYTIQAAGVHYCRIEVDHHASSQATITISRSGSVSATLATLTLPGSSGSNGFSQSTTVLIAAANFAVSDVVSFAISSSNVVDQQLNNIKARLIVRLGPIA